MTIPYRRFIPLIVLLTIAALMTFLVKDFVREVIISPFLLAVWYTTLILNAFPDTFYWALFIIATVVIAIRSLTRRADLERRPRRQTIETGGPVTTWSRLIEHADDGGYSRWQLSQSLCKLTWDMVQNQDHRSMQRIEEQLRNQTLDLPSEIQAYFEAGLLPYQPLSKLQRRLRMNNSPAALDLDPAEVVSYLEQRNPLTSQNQNQKG